MLDDQLLPGVLPSIEQGDIYAFADSEDGESEHEEPAGNQQLSVCIPSILISPRSCYEPFQAPCPTMSEREALRILLPSRSDDDDFLELQLNDFVVYRGKEVSQVEMRSLNQLGTEKNSPALFFDGVLSNGTQSAYVHRVAIHALPIGNYGQQSTDATRDNIWLQSERNATRDIFYKLGTPAEEYGRFFKPFLWVADLAKHFVDFLTAMHVNQQRVTIHHFRQDFAVWLLSAYASPSSNRIEEIRAWMSKYPRLDYRSAVNTNIAFLYKEYVGALGNQRTDFHPVWKEVLLFQKYTLFCSHVDGFRTVVTRYIYDCFNHLPFGKLLEPVEFGPLTARLRSGLIAKRRLPKFYPSSRHNSTDLADIGPGDTISTEHDTVESGSAWEKSPTRDGEHDDLWFALVQSVSIDSDGHRVFEVIWYYQPVDTLCGLMKYPWPNELFLSDHCSCGEDSKIREDEVRGVHEVEFGGMPGTSKEFFCRQMYLVDDRAWMSLTQSHLRCVHHVGDAPVLDGVEYCVRDTVLVHLVKSSDICEPCEIIATEKDLARTRYVFRRLPRRHRIDPTTSSAPPNEVVYTEETVRTGQIRIVGRCQIRWFPADTPIPIPYNRDGVGAFFFVTHRKEEVDGGYTISPLEEAPPSLNQGYDPRQNSIPKLRGLDLFCGGGNFGRGLEEGGAVMMKWANDIDSKALHTYMANTKDTEQVAPFLGSVDDFQRLAIQGKFTNNVPRIGQVDFISGGSPCPGFSLMTNDKTTDTQRKNQSLVAAFASCVDLYRPKYGVLENVVGIIQKHSNRDQDVFSQLMCTLVGMGYQARLFLLDALSCGSAQIRPRVFIIFVAPGWRLPETPLQTHSYPTNVHNFSLGHLPTGESMARRQKAKCTPFRYKTAAQAVAGLPRIYDAKPDICVPFPDHRVVSFTNTSTMRNRVRLIPKFPYGMNFSQAWYGKYRTEPRAAGRGILTKSERSLFPLQGAMVTSIHTNAYGRMLPNQPMATVVTCPSPGDAKQGRTIHWDEDRCLSIMEAKRAQGFLDEEILLGPTATQWKIIGNSVAREVSLALGVVIADAVMRSYGGNFRALDESEEAMVESPYWEAASSRLTESDTPETSAPTSPGATAQPNGSRKRRRVE